ncbi:MAG: AI-2E family transporter [Lachnospiraceae bacterium]|nr:AI-2E family transporter [Lachnospiraceae bacterium]
MKFRWDKKYLYWGLTALLVIIGSILFYYILFHGKTLKAGFSKVTSICMPIIDGLILAYLLNPILNFIEKQVIGKLYELFHMDVKQHKKRIRSFSIILTVIFFFLVLYGFLMLFIPQLLGSVQSIILQFPTYVDNLEDWIEELLANNKQIEQIVTELINRYSSELQSWLENTLMPQINVLIRELSLSVIGFAKFLWNFIIGLVISIYVMGLKENFAAQGKKMLFALLSEEHAGNFIKDLRFVDATFGGFISGKIIDSAIIGILCFCGMTLLKLPYVVLVSVIVGITNIIPFFGPYLGAVPSAILILMVNPPQVIPFIIFILILQQFDGNILGPKILGNSTGLNSFWVIFSITIFGGFFGILGMAVGVPIFAVIYALVKRRITVRLSKKGMPTNTVEYMGKDDYYNESYIPLNPYQKQEKKPLFSKIKLPSKQNEK